MSIASKALAYLAELQGDTPCLKRQHEDQVAYGLLTPPPGMEIGYGREGESIEKMRKNREEFLGYYLRHRDVIPPNQSITDYEIMQRLKNIFDKSIMYKFQNRAAYNYSDKVYFGTVESNVLNGMIMPVPQSNEYLIVLNRSLWESLQILSFLIAAPLNFDPSPFAFDPDSAKKYLTLFTQLHESILLNKELPAFFADRAVADDEHLNWFWSQLHEAMHAFVFGHEYAHFLHGHFNRDSRVASSEMGDRAYSHYRTDWFKEFEADRTGLDLAVFRFLELLDEGLREGRFGEFGELGDLAQQFLRREHIILALQGAALFLQFFNYLESWWCPVYSADSTHPPPLLRIGSIMSAIHQQNPDPNSFEDILNRLRPLMDCLSYFDSNLTGPIQAPFPGVARFAERQLQEAVFGQIFQRTFFDILSDLHQLRGLVSRARGAIGGVRTDLSQIGPQNWIEVFHRIPDASDLAVSTVCEMLDRCIGVLEKNADLWNIRRPKSEGKR